MAFAISSTFLRRHFLGMKDAFDGGRACRDVFMGIDLRVATVVMVMVMCVVIVMCMVTVVMIMCVVRVVSMNLVCI